MPRYWFWLYKALKFIAFGFLPNLLFIDMALRISLPPGTILAVLLLTYINAANLLDLTSGIFYEQRSGLDESVWHLLHHGSQEPSHVEKTECLEPLRARDYLSIGGLALFLAVGSGILAVGIFMPDPGMLSPVTMAAARVYFIPMCIVGFLGAGLLVRGLCWATIEGRSRVERWRGGVGFDIVCFGVSPAVSQ